MSPRKLRAGKQRRTAPSRAEGRANSLLRSVIGRIAYAYYRLTGVIWVDGQFGFASNQPRRKLYRLSVVSVIGRRKGKRVIVTVPSWGVQLGLFTAGCSKFPVADDLATLVLALRHNEVNTYTRACKIPIQVWDS